MLEKHRLKAACKDRDINLFFDKKASQAKHICNSCEVIQECRDYAVENFIEAGVWGGMTHRELNAYRKQKLGVHVKAPKRNWVIR